MQLNKLCIILPADFDETNQSSSESKSKSLSSDHRNQRIPRKEESKKHPHRGCGGQIVALIKDSLSGARESRWVRFCHHGRAKKHHHSGALFHDTEGMQLTDKVGGDNPRIFSYTELYIGSNGFSDKELLGSGGFGRVYKAVLPSDGTAVAVKCLAERGERFEKTFVAELVAVAQLRHRNLVRLRGWCVHADHQLLLVYDYMPNLSLDRILFKSPENTASPPLSWDHRRKIANGLAAALFYLHEQLETQIIHRDVKTSNVMLDSHYNARLGDFGLARWLEHELEHHQTMTVTPLSLEDRRFRLAETTKIGGTIGYLPPESFQRRSVATAKSDVFSFGIVLLEVVSGRRAVDLTYDDDRIILLDWIRRLSDERRLLQAGDTRLQDGSYSLSDMERLIHIGLLCTLHNPQLRPNMKWVVEALSGNLHGKLPPLPSFQSHPPYISLSSPTNTNSSNTDSTTSITTTSTTATSISSNYVTAREETIYETAENGTTDTTKASRDGGCRNRAVFPMVQTPVEISFAEIISATDNFSDSRRVAELDFGTAYHGILKNRQHILVKRLGMKTCPALRQRFSNELQSLGRLRHRNLVQLRGWCTEQGEMLVVYDYSVNRHLNHLLFYENRVGFSPLQWNHRYNIIKSLASAIHYLHEEWDEQVIHRSITSSAVILDPDMNPRLSSFALAEFLTRNEHGNPHVVIDKKKSVRGIFGYMSPEHMESGDATTMADVYSFGVVMLEVVSGQMAVDFRRPEVLLVKRVHDFIVQNRPLEELADIRLNGEFNRTQLIRLVKLGIECTGSDPESRPSMSRIVGILDGNDQCFMAQGQKKESLEEWKQVNASSWSLVKRIQALGIQ